MAEYLFSSISMTPQTEQYQYPSFLSTIPTEFSRVCCRCPPTFESKPASEETWGQSERDVNSAAPGFSFVSHNLGTMSKSPLRYVEFRVFRRFGFAIWDLRRMAALGLLHIPDKAREEDYYQREIAKIAPVSESDEYFRWRSILTEEELEKVERRRKHYWPSQEIIPIPDYFG